MLEACSAKHSRTSKQTLLFTAVLLFYHTPCRVLLTANVHPCYFAWKAPRYVANLNVWLDFICIEVACLYGVGVEICCS